MFAIVKRECEYVTLPKQQNSKTAKQQNSKTAKQRMLFQQYGFLRHFWQKCVLAKVRLRKKLLFNLFLLVFNSM